MIGNYVHLITTDGRPGMVKGVLQKLDAVGAVINRVSSHPEGRGNVFIPAHRIQEIVDQGPYG